MTLSQPSCVLPLYPCCCGRHHSFMFCIMPPSTKLTGFSVNLCNKPGHIPVTYVVQYSSKLVDSEVCLTKPCPRFVYLITQISSGDYGEGQDCANLMEGIGTSAIMSLPQRNQCLEAGLHSVSKSLMYVCVHVYCMCVCLCICMQLNIINEPAVNRSKLRKWFTILTAKVSFLRIKLSHSTAQLWRASHVKSMTRLGRLKQTFFLYLNCGEIVKIRLN